MSQNNLRGWRRIKNMVTWQAIIKYIGDDELTFIETENEWIYDSDLHFHPYTKGDQMLDSNGDLYDISYDDKEKMVKIVKTNKAKTMSEFEILIKNHMVSLNQCCSSKIKLSSFKDGILLVKKMNE